MDVGSLVSLLVALVILGVIFYVVMWAIKTIGLPEPFGKVAIALIVLVFVLLLLGILFGGIDVPRPLFWRR